MQIVGGVKLQLWLQYYIKQVETNVKISRCKKICFVKICFQVIYCHFLHYKSTPDPLCSFVFSNMAKSQLSSSSKYKTKMC